MWVIVMLGAVGVKNNLWLKMKKWLGFHPPLPQRYYPQCTACSSKQSQAVKMDRRTLVVHMAGPRAWHYAGGLGLLNAESAMHTLLL